MRKTAVFLLTALIICAPVRQAASKKIQVVTTTLDMADFVKKVGGDRVKVKAIFKGLTDMHFFEPIPSHVMKMKRADMLVVAGLDADAWAKGLIDASRNPRIRFGSVGYVDPSDGIRPIQVPEGRIDGSMGHVHPYGNPHYLFTPENITVAVDNIYEGLLRISPEDGEYFKKNRDVYVREITRTFSELKNKIAPFEGTGVIGYHRSWDYFCGYFGLDLIATLEPKPGIPPSAKHLNDVVRIARAMNAKLMLIEPYYPEKPVNYVSREVGIDVVRIPVYMGTVKGIDSYIDMLKYNVDKIVDALSPKGSQ